MTISMPDETFRQSGGCGKVLGVIWLENMVISVLMGTFGHFHLRNSITKVLDTGFRSFSPPFVRNNVLYKSLIDDSRFYSVGWGAVTRNRVKTGPKCTFVPPSHCSWWPNTSNSTKYRSRVTSKYGLQLFSPKHGVAEELSRCYCTLYVIFYVFSPIFGSVVDLYLLE